MTLVARHSRLTNCSLSHSLSLSLHLIFWIASLVHFLHSCKDMITTFRKLDLFPSSGKKEDAAIYRGADKSLARPGRKQDTATEDFEFHISYL
jgi:hypothetical protein